jgi:hypothetical protein
LLIPGVNSPAPNVAICRIFRMLISEKAAEAADTRQDFRALCALDEWLDPIYKFIASVDVDASIFVRKWFIAHFGVAYSGRAI